MITKIKIISITLIVLSINLLWAQIPFPLGFLSESESSPPPGTPIVPTLISPSNNSTDVSTNVFFDWYDSSGATSYSLQVDDNSNFGSLLLNQTGITQSDYYLSGLSDCTTYYWRVKAVNSTSSSSWSTAWSFTTDGCTSINTQLFPIGAYWVKDETNHNNEMISKYGQVASCGFNIIVGGQIGSSSITESQIFSAASNNNLQIISDSDNSIKQYASGKHRTYNVGGYTSNPLLGDIENPLEYSFINDTGINTGTEIIAHPTSGDLPGYILHGYHCKDWWTDDAHYFTFHLQIDKSYTGNVAHVQVIANNGAFSLVDDIIHSDDFNDNNYRDFVYNFTYPNDENINSYGIEFKIDWYGNIPLSIKHITVENNIGHELFSGNKDSEILNAANLSKSYDLGNNLMGFYFDEPRITQVESIGRINDIIGSSRSSSSPFLSNIVLNSTVAVNAIMHQYLLQGPPQYRPEKLLVDRYTLDFYHPEKGHWLDTDGTTSPAPNHANSNYYNTFLQEKLNILINGSPDKPNVALKDAALVSKVYNKDFWFAVQAHSWRNLRNPAPSEMNCFVNLGLAYGAKGIFYFLYATIEDYINSYDDYDINGDDINDSVEFEFDAVGLVNKDFEYTDINKTYHNRMKFNGIIVEENDWQVNHWEKWNTVKDINFNIHSMAETLLALNWETAFTSTSAPGETRPVGVVNVWDIQNAEYIEVGSFTHNDGSLYFMLVNRKCHINDTQTMLVEVNVSGQANSILDVLANQNIYETSSGSKTFEVTLEPGEGRLYKIIQ